MSRLPPIIPTCFQIKIADMFPRHATSAEHRVAGHLKLESTRVSCLYLPPHGCCYGCSSFDAPDILIRESSLPSPLTFVMLSAFRSLFNSKRVKEPWTHPVEVETVPIASSTSPILVAAQEQELSPNKFSTFTLPDGATLAYEILGSSHMNHAAPIVLICGMTSVRIDFERLTQSLIKTRPGLIFGISA